MGFFFSFSFNLFAVFQMDELWKNKIYAIHTIAAAGSESSSPPSQRWNGTSQLVTRSSRTCPSLLWATWNSDRDVDRCIWEVVVSKMDIVLLLRRHSRPSLRPILRLPTVLPLPPLGQTHLWLCQSRRLRTLCSLLFRSQPIRRWLISADIRRRRAE